MAMLSMLLSASAQAVPSVRLNDGVVMPLLSFGLQVRVRMQCNLGSFFDGGEEETQVYGDDTAENLTKTAINAGFRNIFTSVLAGNQPGVGRALKEATVPRKELFVCGSVNSASCSGTDNCYQATQSVCCSRHSRLTFRRPIVAELAD
jgi:diketogulonate reductase-like aldo/keto reductase